MIKRFIHALDWAVIGIEILVAVGLVALAAGALLNLGLEIVNVANEGPALSHANFNSIINTVLEVFILVELFRIAIAYMRHDNVIPTVFEAALVAVARKYVVFEGGGNYLYTALGLAALLLSVAGSWWALSRTGVCELETHEARHFE